MNKPLYSLDLSSLESISDTAIQHSIKALESGQVVYCPHYCFRLNSTEHTLLSESVLHPKHKNISYDFTTNKLAGVNATSSVEQSELMKAFMHRYAKYSHQLVTALIPAYANHLKWGRTSYRPAEIKNRPTSKRKDDTRLHVDAFSATPVYGQRILRVFCNINPHNQPRTWELGEPFSQVIKTFSNKIPAYSPIRAKWLHWIKATKTQRSHYDHLMIHLHDKMKLDNRYQQTTPKHRIEFPAQSSWMVFTDSVSHAALGGQYLLEQTFYLPVSAMDNPNLSPLKQWESLKSL